MAEQDQDKSQKTEEPTQKRLDDARKKGDVVDSREVTNWFMLAAATLAVGLFLPSAGGAIMREMHRFLERPHDIAFGEESLRLLMSEVMSGVGLAIALPMGLFVVAALAAPLAQHGFIFTTEKMKPSLEKISPLGGLKRMFSLRSVAELVKGLLKIAMVAAVTATVLWPEREELPHIPSMELPSVLEFLFWLGLKIFGGVVILLTAVAIIDYMYQTFEHRKKLRMSRQEVRDEQKQSEGDPHIKARLRAIRNERARQRMMAAVPTADVVITNPTHYAVALSYDQDVMAAPKVVAKGVDEVALRIRETADEHEVPIFENPPLARGIFATADIDEFIKPEHFKAVAEIIAFVMGISKVRPRPSREEAFDPLAGPPADAG
ncbi:MAG: flagellar biosynthesis protein FlhB [Alphaproteobacteria bacterium]|nr:flagellar biosynthesis protein FlhB [Alphaproteobacteria bacterium]